MGGVILFLATLLRYTARQQNDSEEILVTVGVSE